MVECHDWLQQKLIASDTISAGSIVSLSSSLIVVKNGFRSLYFVYLKTVKVITEM
jgi:hypothetical protein